MRRLLRLAGVVVVAVLALAGPAAAHPLGNFTVNHLTRITVERGVLHARYVLDLAEIPAFTLDRSLDAHGTPPRAALDRWAAAHAREIAPLLELSVDGREVALVPGASHVVERPGAGGLPTLYATLNYAATIGSGAHRLTYRDRTEAGRLGWRDVVTGTTQEPTGELRSYPSALIGSPRARTAIAARIDAAGAITVDPSAGEDAGTPAAASPSLARSNPLAVSLVGARATTRQALILATALTVAHTAGVIALGLVVLAATQWIVPEQVYPWITLLSGIVVTIVGGRALAAEVRRRLPFAHAHRHVHQHAHPHAHDHVHAAGDAHEHLDDAEHAKAHAIPGTAPLTFRSAVLAAASGNIAPCPAALVVLLAAIALHRVGYGLALIVAFSIGLAAVLTVLGIAVVRSAAWLVARPQFDRVAHFAPLITAFVIATIGSVMVGQGFAAQGFDVPVAVVSGLVLRAIVGYALAWHQHKGPAESGA